MTIDSEQQAREVRLVVPLLALAEAGIPPDIQELLVHGNPSRGVPPGALVKALTAFADEARLAERAKAAKVAQDRADAYAAIPSPSVLNAARRGEAETIATAIRTPNEGEVS